MDRDILKSALDDLRSDMRKRVGKHLLSIEIHQPLEEGEGDEADDDAQPDDSKEPTPAKKMGVPLL